MTGGSEKCVCVIAFAVLDIEVMFSRIHHWKICQVNAGIHY